MEAKAIGLDRRQFLSGVSLAAMAGIPRRVLPTESEQGAAPWTGTILHAADGQRIPLAGGRELTIKVDSQRSAAKDLPIRLSEILSGRAPKPLYAVEPARVVVPTPAVLVHHLQAVDSTELLHQAPTPRNRTASNVTFVDSDLISVVIAMIVPILIVIIPVMGYVHHVGAQREGFVRQPGP